MQLDEIDRALLTALTANSRTPIATLGQQLGIARTTVQARIDRLENRGVIAGYTMRPGKTSQPALRATALVAIEPRAAPAVLSWLKSLHNVVAVHATSGRFDLLVQLTAQTTEELDVTLDHIGAARSIRAGLQRANQTGLEKSQKV
jgi:DNA-binding Lrp family transcriptional regulator